MFLRAEFSDHGAMTPAATTRIAHVSDPHLTTLQGIGAGELCSKRILGYLSWRWRRRREHRADVLALLMADLAARAPDQVIVTGDLTHVGTPRECQAARSWLDAIATRAPVTLVPGNHDTYIPMPWADTLGHWAPYMRGDDAAGNAGPDLFPAMRRRGDIAFIGLSTAVPSPPFCATGRLGPAQLAALATLLADTERAGLFRLVILHHPPLPDPHDWRRSLTDAHALQQVLQQAGAELVVHGHSHCWLETSLPGPVDAIPALGTPSASALTPRPGRRAGYSIMEVSATADGWRVGIVRHGLDEAGTGMRELARHELLRPRRAR